MLARYVPQQLLNLVGWHNGGADKLILDEPRVRCVLAQNLRCAFKHGSLGGVHDLIAVTRPWPFDLTAIQSLQLWHGDQDPVVPLLHSQWLAQQVPHARLRVIENEGHFSLPIKYAEQIMSRLVGAAETPAEHTAIPSAG